MATAVSHRAESKNGKQSSECLMNALGPVAVLYDAVTAKPPEGLVGCNAQAHPMMMASQTMVVGMTMTPSTMD